MRVDVVEGRERVPGSPVIHGRIDVAVDRDLNLGAVRAQIGAHAHSVVVHQVDDLEVGHRQIVVATGDVGTRRDGQVDRVGDERLHGSEVRALTDGLGDRIEMDAHVQRVGRRQRLRAVRGGRVRAAAGAAGVRLGRKAAALEVMAVAGSRRTVEVPVHRELRVEPAFRVPFVRAGEAAAGNGGQGVCVDAGRAAVHVEAVAGGTGAGIRQSEDVGGREAGHAVAVLVESLAQDAVIESVGVAVRAEDESLGHAGRDVDVRLDADALCPSKNLERVGREAEVDMGGERGGALRSVARPEGEARSGLQGGQAPQGHDPSCRYDRRAQQ